MPHIVIAGLAEKLSSWLQQRLGAVSVQVIYSSEEILEELERDNWSLLILDRSVISESVAKALEGAYSQLKYGKQSILYCLAKNLGSNLPRKLVGHILFHPFDWEELAAVTAEILELPLPPVPVRESQGNGNGKQESSRVDEKLILHSSPHSDPKASEALSEPITATSSLDSLQSEIAELWEKFKGKIINRVAVLDQAAVTLLTGNLNDELRQKAVGEAHKLAGCLGTFGFPNGSSLARDIEQLLRPKVTLGQNQAQRFAELVAALHRSLNETPAKEASEPSSGDRQLRFGVKQPRLLIIGDDTDLAQRLVMEAVAWGMHADSVNNVSDARKIIQNTHLDLVLLDLTLSDAESEQDACTPEELILLKELSGQTPPVPAIVLTFKDTLINRVEVARLGGCAFLQKPVTPIQAMEAVTHVLKQSAKAQFKLVVVDDDPQILAAIQVLLQPWGLKLTTLDDPRRLWDTLDTAAPDLLILDVDMPYVNGIELCQVIRNDPKWNSLPVLFLSSYKDPATVQQVFNVGADDFVNKPIAGTELVSRIFNRLERIRLLRSIAETDILTGVANRRKGTQDLERFLRLASRHDQPLCFAILDLDYFKRINDEYGHAAGDQVLQRLGRLLLQSFRSEDVVARWGGEEFAIGLYSMTKQAAVKRLSQILNDLRQEEFIEPDGRKFRVSFSAGVVQYPEDGTDLLTLYKKADELLYQAKAAGRDRVLMGQDSAH